MPRARGEYAAELDAVVAREGEPLDRLEEVGTVENVIEAAAVVAHAEPEAAAARDDAEAEALPGRAGDGVAPDHREARHGVGVLRRDEERVRAARDVRGIGRERERRLGRAG